MDTSILLSDKPPNSHVYSHVDNTELSGPPSTDGRRHHHWMGPLVLAIQMHDAILGAGANPAVGPKFTIA